MRYAREHNLDELVAVAGSQVGSWLCCNAGARPGLIQPLYELRIYYQISTDMPNGFAQAGDECLTQVREGITGRVREPIHDQMATQIGGYR